MSGVEGGSSATEAAEALEEEKRRLEHSLSHLSRSNDELRAALLAEPEEREYVLAIRENCEVMDKYLAQVAALQAQLDALRH